MSPIPEMQLEFCVNSAKLEVCATGFPTYHGVHGVQGHNSVRILNKGRYVTGPWTTRRIVVKYNQIPQFWVCSEMESPLYDHFYAIFMGNL